MIDYNMQEVKKEVKEVKNSSLLDIVFASLEAGKTTKQICKDLSISKQKLQYYLGKLKSENRIQKLGYGVWQTSKNTVANSVRGHGFMWHIKLPKEILIWENILNNKNISYRKLNKDRTIQFYFKENKVWLSRSSIIIYDIKSYFGFNALDSKKFAMYELQTFLNQLQAKLGIDFQFNGKYIIKTSRQHYALIRNSLAIQCRKDGKKINVYNERGLWFTIDNSFNLEEAETVHPDTALIDNLGVQKYFNEHKETKWEWTPKTIGNSIGQMLEVQKGLLENQQMHSHNIIKHQKVLDEMLITLKKIQDKLDGIL
jgi:hypothetical protein